MHAWPDGSQTDADMPASGLDEGHKNQGWQSFTILMMIMCVCVWCGQPALNLRLPSGSWWLQAPAKESGGVVDSGLRE